MREIKFRGYDEENKTWRYGHFFETVEGVRRCYNIVENREIKYYVNSDSVGEYTGLKDKTGKEIYEGDIVLTTYGKWEEEKKGLTRIGKIIYDNKMASFRMSVKNSAVMVGFYDINNIEIIGNIYENPELI